MSCGRCKSYCLPACHTLVRRYCWTKRPGSTLHVRLRETGSPDVLWWLAGDSFSNFSWTECGYARSLWRLKQHQLDKLPLWFWCVGKNGSCSAHSSHVKLATTKYRTSNLFLQGMLWCDMVIHDAKFYCMRWSCFVTELSATGRSHMVVDLLYMQCNRDVMLYFITKR